MIDIVLKKDKTIRRTKHEDIYEGENKISWINVYLPETINDIDIKDYNIVLRCYINADNYIPYTLDTTKSINKIDITHEFTDKDRYIDAYLYITRADEVIGKTNTVSFRVNKAKDGSGLTPREHLDERIAELENENEVLEREVAEKETEIEAKDGQISELNDEITEKDGQITELTNENTRLENLTDTQRETIQYMIDNQPQPVLEELSVISTSEEQTITPQSGVDGFSKVIVGEILGGVFFENVDEYGNPTRIVIANWVTSNVELRLVDFTYLEEVEFKNCEIVTSVLDSMFENCIRLKKIINFPQNIKVLYNSVFRSCSSLEEFYVLNRFTSFRQTVFQQCTNLKKIYIPSSLNSIGYNVFGGCKNLEFVTIENGFNCNGLNVSASTRFTAETIVACLEALADRTGQTAYTIVFGSTNLNKLTAEQKAIATNKNWNLA